MGFSRSEQQGYNRKEAMKYLRKFYPGIVALAFLVVSNVMAQEKVHRVLEESDTVATVVSLNLETRMVTLKDDSGYLVSFRVSDEIKDLDKVKVGDRVKVQYYKAMAAEILPVGASVGYRTENKVVTSARPGDPPGGGISLESVVNVIIEDINLEERSVTVTDPDGVHHTIHVDRPEGLAFLKQLKVGDYVDVTFKEAMAISVKNVDE